MDIKTNFLWHKNFENDLVAICKSKVTLILNKQAYTGMRILKLTKVLTYEFHYDYIKNKYGNSSELIFTGTDRFTSFTVTDKTVAFY